MSKSRVKILVAIYLLYNPMPMKFNKLLNPPDPLGGQGVHPLFLCWGNIACRTERSYGDSPICIVATDCSSAWHNLDPLSQKRPHLYGHQTGKKTHNHLREGVCATGTHAPYSINRALGIINKHKKSVMFIHRIMSSQGIVLAPLSLWTSI